jgi:hypothetical protein
VGAGAGAKRLHVEEEHIPEPDCPHCAALVRSGRQKVRDPAGSDIPCHSASGAWSLGHTRCSDVFAENYRLAASGAGFWPKGGGCGTRLRHHNNVVAASTKT